MTLYTANATTPSQWVRPLLETLISQGESTFQEIFDSCLANYSLNLSGGTDLQRCSSWLILVEHLRPLGAVEVERGSSPLRFRATCKKSEIDTYRKLQNKLAVSKSMR